MSPRSPWISGCAAVIVLQSTIVPADDPSKSFAIVDRIPISSPRLVSAWDDATIDPRTRQLFLSTVYRSGGGLVVLDLDSGRERFILDRDKMPHGMVFLGNGTAAVADGIDHTVLFFSERSGRVSHAVDTGKPPHGDDWHNPDSLLLEPRTGLLLAVNKDSGTLALIDVPRHVVIGTIEIGGDLEAPAARGDGTVYVNIKSKGAIAVVDLPARKRIREIALEGCQHPNGLRYDLADRLLISQCENGVAKFLDPDSGSEVASIATAKAADGVIFDTRRKLAFIAGADGTLSIISVRDRQHIGIVQSVATQPATRLGALDPATGRIYLPAAKPDLKAPPLHLSGLPDKPKVAPGSFEFLVVGARE